MSKTKAELSVSPPSSEHHVEHANTMNVSGLDGLSLYQKKCILVNREIDAQGMGRYEWYIWALCGCGYFLDLLWAQAFGLVLSPLQQELGFGDGKSGNIATSFNAGLTAGAFFWGFIADIIGQLLTHLHQALSYLILLASNTSARSKMGLQFDLFNILRIWSLSWCLK